MFAILLSMGPELFMLDHLHILLKIINISLLYAAMHMLAIPCSLIMHYAHAGHFILSSLYMSLHFLFNLLYTYAHFCSCPS